MKAKLKALLKAKGGDLLFLFNILIIAGAAFGTISLVIDQKVSILWAIPACLAVVIITDLD